MRSSLPAARRVRRCSRLVQRSGAKSRRSCRARSWSPPESLTHLRALARQPRPAGGAAAASALQYCEEHLTGLGFVTERREFEFSSLPGRFGAPIIGGAGALLSMIVAGRALARDPDTRAYAYAAIGIVVLLLIILGGSAGVRLPVARRR